MSFSSWLPPFNNLIVFSWIAINEFSSKWCWQLAHPPTFHRLSTASRPTSTVLPSGSSTLVHKDEFMKGFVNSKQSTGYAYCGSWWLWWLCLTKNRLHQHNSIRDSGLIFGRSLASPLHHEFSFTESFQPHAVQHSQPLAM